MEQVHPAEVEHHWLLDDRSIDLLPRRNRHERPRLPAEEARTAGLLGDVPLRRVVQPQQQPCLRHRERAQRPRREASSASGGGPGLEPSGSPAPVSSWRHHRVDLLAEDLLLDRETVSAARRRRRLQGIEHRRVVVHRCGHPPV